MLSYAHEEMGARVVVAMNIRGLAPKVRQALKERAARHGVSMEEEVRRILIHAVGADEPGDLAVVFLSAFGPSHGVELEIPSRNEMPRELDFS